MATCDACGTSIVFGGVKDSGYRFCNHACRSSAVHLFQGAGLSENVVLAEAMRIRESPCPDCNGEGPLDVHTHYWVWSAIAFTRWGQEPRICCRGCARGRQISHAAKSMVLGWWGFPWGVVFTPLQVVRNIAAAARSNKGYPSPELIRLAQSHLGSRM